MKQRIFLSLILFSAASWVVAGPIVNRVASRFHVTATSDLSVSSLRSITPIAQQTGYVGTIVVPPSDSDGGLFSVTGLAGNTGVGQVLQSSIVLSSGSSGGSITTFGWTYGGDMDGTGKFTLPAGSSTTTLSNLELGASTYVGSGVTPGIYTGTGTFQVSVNGEAAVTSFNVTMVILSSNSVENQRPMIFPAQMEGYAGTYVLNPTAAGAASFSATGLAGEAAVAQVTPNVIYLTRNGSSDTISVFGFTFGGAGGSINYSTGEFTFPSGSGQTVIQDLYVGASAYYPSGISGGTYTGTGTLTIAYQ
jgi:hypothetical protein